MIRLLKHLTRPERNFTIETLTVPMGVIWIASDLNGAEWTVPQWVTWAMFVMTPLAAVKLGRSIVGWLDRRTEETGR